MSNNPRGKLNTLLCFDVETTGLCFSSATPVYNSKTKERHQALSWGLIVADAATLTPIEDLYLEVKWNNSSTQQRIDNPDFGRSAEKVHGLTKEYLDQNGVDEEEAVVRIGNLIAKHWGTDVSVKTMGHNVHLFDLQFLRDLFDRYGIMLATGNRHYDTNSLGFFTVGAFNSDDLFNTMGLEQRQTHNALDDAHMTLETARRIRTLWDQMVGVKAYE